MPRLIVNADDLGLTAGVNRAILRSHREGIVTSATLMANAPASIPAVSLLKEMSSDELRKFGVGCHIVLIDGSPLSSPEHIPSLLRADATFYKKLWRFALAAVRGRISVREVEIEASAQIRALQDAGVSLSHVDCHKHSHMFPPVLEGVLRAAVANGIRAIRNPFEPSFARPAGIALSKRSLVRSTETSLLAHKFSRQFREYARRFGLATTDGSVGVTLTGSLDANGLAEMLQNLPSQGTYELVTHPGYNDPALAAAGTRLLQSRETELQLLCAPESRSQLQAAGVELINYWDLVPAEESEVTAIHPMH